MSSVEFSTTGARGTASDGAAQLYADLKLYFYSKTGRVTGQAGSRAKPVVLRDANGRTITITTTDELQSSSWLPVVDDNTDLDGWILTGTNHF